MNKLCTFEETAAYIESGERLLLAGDETVLRHLPLGQWIGGTTPYFIGNKGGIVTREKVLVSSLPRTVTAITTRLYDEQQIRNIAAEGPDHGFTFLIIPAFSSLLQGFSKNVRDYPGIFNRPLMGWVSGVAPDDPALIQPYVVDGRTGEWSSERAVALHGTLENRVVAEIGIVNPFTQGAGDVITVDKAGFTFGHAYVNGVLVNLARYLKEQNIDMKLPLVADYLGAMVNVSIRSVDPERGHSVFYAPLFPDIEYKIAIPVDDYENVFAKTMKNVGTDPMVAVSCILNYVHGHLDWQQFGSIHGPISFGEIAYGLLNQTLVYMVLRRT
ncbi:MAG: hypothetical protein P4M00_20405 [Azospirillaceae bacterium]|nr:hypothetical protein [Azospirillaceae bacterium]